MKRHDILLVHISPNMTASFVRHDFDLLNESFSVSSFFYRGVHDLPALVHAVVNAKLVFCWFAWDHAYWATSVSGMLKKPSVLVTGGFDLVGIPEIGYGSLLAARSSARVRATLKRATRILAISESIRTAATSLSGRQDVAFVPLGFDPDQIPFSAVKESLALTVGALNESNSTRKGIGAFLDLARHFSEVRFCLVGDVDPLTFGRLLPRIPANVKVTGRVGDEVLINIYRRAKVYVQLSAHEGFGSAVAEAMLAGCIPLVSDRGALPEIAGDVGIVVPYGDPEAAKRGFVQALNAPIEESIACRERIVKAYPLDIRKRTLVATVGDLLSEFYGRR